MRNPNWTEVVNQLVHVESELCWCDPIVEMDEYGPKGCFAQSGHVALNCRESKPRERRDGGALIGRRLLIPLI